MLFQIPPSCSPVGFPVNVPGTNAPTIVTLTPPPEKDMKEIKIESKPTNILAQGKENIPLIDEKSLGPKSPELIDLVHETESTPREKIVIPTLKKRKLEILREGGLEVTPVELGSRSPVLPNSATSCISRSRTPTVTNPAISLINQSNGMDHENSPFILPSTGSVAPKLINVTVTPDISHMLPMSDSSSFEESNSLSLTVKPLRTEPSVSLSNGLSPNSGNSRIINLSTKSNTRFQPNKNLNSDMLALDTMIRRPIQSKSMFAYDYNERVVYGDPKETMRQSNCLPPQIPAPQARRYL